MKKLISVFLCLFAISVSHVYAMEATFDRDTHIVTVRGKAVRNELISILITDDKVEMTSQPFQLSDIIGAPEDHIIGFYNINADENGDYSVLIESTQAGAGLYNFFVAGPTTKDTTQIELYPADDLGTALTAISTAAASGADAVAAKLNDESFRKLIGLDNLYKGLPDKSLLALAIAKNSSYTTYADLYNATNTPVTPVYVPSGDTSGGSSSSGGGGGGSFIAVTPSDKTPAAQVFSDVPTTFWGYDAIRSLYEKGIVSGVGNGNFAPNETVKREEFVKMFVVLTGLEVNGQKDNFADTDKSAWYSPYLAVAQECGLAFGREDGSFGVGEVLTRQDMAVLAARVLGSTERGYSAEFDDEGEISDYARNSVAILCGLKVMNGMGDGNFAPKETATRAQAAKVIYEIAKLLK